MDTATAPRVEASTRLSWLDTFRGLSIALVVVGHVLGGLAFASFVSEGDRVRLWGAYDLLYTFRMPALFLASGLFAARSLRRGFESFLGDKTRTLAYPYLLWSLIGWAAHSVASGMTNTAADPWTPLKILYDPMKGVWFLYVLFVAMLLYGAWASRGGGRWGFLAFGAALHASPLLIDPLPSLAAQVCRFLVYFALGIVLADHVRAIAGRLTPGRLLLLVPSAFGMMKAFVALGLDEHPVLDLLPALCGTLGMFGVAMLIDRLPGVSALRHFGRQSLQIYVAGGHASVAGRIALQRALGVEAVSVHVALGTIAGLVFPMLLVSACRLLGFRYLFTWPKPVDRGSLPVPNSTNGAVAIRRGPIAGGASP